MEWNSSGDLAAYFQQVLGQEMAIEGYLHPDRHIRITDNQHFNEYYLLRRWQWISP